MLAASPGTLIGTHSGLRGRPGEGLTDEVVTGAVRGLAARLAQDGLPAIVAVGRDGRASSLRLAGIVTEAALAAGVDVVDLGVAATATVKLATRRAGLGGAVIVTGSHLDASWNGLKLVAGPDYLPLDVRSLPLPEPVAGGRRRGRLSSDGAAAARHARAVVEAVDAETIRRAGLSVAASGGPGPVAALVLEALGCRADGARPDLAFRLDADGDRLSLVDERGRELDPETTLPLLALALDARAVVKGADTSRMVDAVVGGGGGSVRTVPTGELHLARALASAGGDLGGEGNGGAIVPGVVLARDAIAAAATLLGLLARERLPVSALAAGLPALARARSGIPCAQVERAAAALERLAGTLGLACPDPHVGVTIEHPDGAWALVRLSATEPLLRITAEAPSAGRARELHEGLRARLAADLGRA